MLVAATEQWSCEQARREERWLGGREKKMEMEIR